MGKKLSLIHEKFDFQLHNFSVTKCSSTSFWVVKAKLSTSGRQLTWLFVGFNVCIVILTVRKVRKNAMNFDSCRHSNCYFSVTTGLISSTEISVENFTLAEETSPDHFFETRIRTLKIRPFEQKFFKKWRNSNLKLKLLCNLAFSIENSINRFILVEFDSYEKQFIFKLPSEAYWS